MYIEDVIASIIRAAATSGKIPWLNGEDVFTDMNGTNEWEGHSKFYVIRDKIELIGDLSQEYSYSGVARSQLTLAALGADKTTADPIIKGALRALRRQLNVELDHLDIYLREEGDIVTIDDNDILAVDFEEATLDDAMVEEADLVTIDEADLAIFGSLNAQGVVTGDGWIITNDWTGNVSPWLVYNLAAREIIDWRLVAASGVERFDTGAWREQYFQTKTIDVLHYVEVE